jgi:hypothetical protein
MATEEKEDRDVTAKEPFVSMTPKQLDYWFREIRPLLVRMREQSEKRARQQALELIRRPLRDRPTGADAVHHGDQNEE